MDGADDRWRAVLSHTARAIVALMLGVAACGGPYDDLPNGYRFFRANSHQQVITKAGMGVVVEADVAELAILGDLVVGFAEPEVVFEGQPPPPRTEPGFFVLDTRTGQLQDDLSRAQWLGALGARGIDEPPELHAPTVWFFLLH